MLYSELKSMPIETLLLIERSANVDPQDRLQAKEMIHARLGEIDGEGWGILSITARQRLVEFAVAHKEDFPDAA